MTPYRTLLAASLKSREAYDMVSLSGESEGFTGELEPIWQAVVKYYEKDPAAHTTDVELIAAEVARAQSGPKHAKAAAGLVAEIASLPVSVPNVADAVRSAALERAGMSLASALVGKSDDTDVRERLETYTQLFEAVPGGADGVESEWRGLIATRVNPDVKWKVTPKSLNEVLGGGVLPGHNITLFARPEAGKTALALTMGCGFARRGKRVLYIGNEDPIEDLKVRALCCLIGKPAHELLKDADRAELEAIKLGASNLFMRELCPGTGAEMERLVRALKPDVLIVDQLRNIRVKGDNFTQQLDKAAQLVRALGKRYKMVTISVTQAGDSARDKAVLDDGDIDSSNTGIPGAADVLIGMGVNDGLRQAGQRCISLCKNKVSARHESFTVYLDPFTSRVRS